ncbi:hypothetical protein ACFVWF_28455 [Rhodococcus qingshengii]|uniref:hypothetical protein n=1 Tax=Rhodococcus qingshengii TaxID=334542 RepID=UPI0036D94EF4
MMTISSLATAGNSARLGVSHPGSGGPRTDAAVFVDQAPLGFYSQLFDCQWTSETPNRCGVSTMDCNCARRHEDTCAADPDQAAA